MIYSTMMMLLAYTHNFKMVASRTVVEQLDEHCAKLPVDIKRHVRDNGIYREYMFKEEFDYDAFRIVTKRVFEDRMSHVIDLSYAGNEDFVIWCRASFDPDEWAYTVDRGFLFESGKHAAMFKLRFG